MQTQDPVASSQADRPESQPLGPNEQPEAPIEDRIEPEPEDVQAALRRRLLSPHTLVSFAIAAAAIWFVSRRIDLDPAAIWDNVRQANLLLLAVAFCFWYGAFFVRGARWGYMLRSAGFTPAAGYALPPTRGLTEIVLLAFFANSIIPAKLGDAYRAYLLKRDAGVPFSAGFGTILAERLVDVLMLVIVLAASALLVFGGQMPDEARPALLLGAILVVAGVAGLGLLWATRNTIARYLPQRFRGSYERLQTAIFGALRRPAVVLGAGLLLWFGDGMRVWFVARSLEAGISPAVAILIAVMGALLTVVPFTPAGLGVVEIGVGSVLVGVLGVDPVVAGSIILLDRVVAYWSLLLVGAVLYVRRLRREYRTAAVPAAASS